MFSRRKLFQMIGLGSAVAATAQIAPSQMAESLWAGDEIDYRSTMTLAEYGRLAETQAAYNAYRSEVIREYARSDNFGPYQG